MNRSGPGRQAKSAQNIVLAQWVAGAKDVASARRAARADTDAFFSCAQVRDAGAGGQECGRFMASS